MTIGEDYLKSLIRWMSNCVQLILYLRGQSSKYRTGGRGRLDDDIQGAFQELASGLEEIVVFCFQQTVYTITKVNVSRLYFEYASGCVDVNFSCVVDKENVSPNLYTVFFFFTCRHFMCCCQQCWTVILSQRIMDQIGEEECGKSQWSLTS